MLAHLTVSSVDYERIHALLESPQHRSWSGVDALRSELDRAEIVEPGKLPDDVVSMNSTVRFVFEPDNEQFEYTLSFPRHAELQDKPRISLLTPIGSALLGLRVGAAIDWTVPSGKVVKLRVTELVQQPEQNGQDLGD